MSDEDSNANIRAGVPDSHTTKPDENTRASPIISVSQPDQDEPEPARTETHTDGATESKEDLFEKLYDLCDRGSKLPEDDPVRAELRQECEELEATLQHGWTGWSEDFVIFREKKFSESCAREYEQACSHAIYAKTPEEWTLATARKWNIAKYLAERGYHITEGRTLSVRVSKEESQFSHLAKISREEAYEPPDSDESESTDAISQLSEQQLRDRQELLQNAHKALDRWRAASEDDKERKIMSDEYLKTKASLREKFPDIHHSAVEWEGKLAAAEEQWRTAPSDEEARRAKSKYEQIGEAYLEQCPTDRPFSPPVNLIMSERATTDELWRQTNARQQAVKSPRSTEQKEDFRAMQDRLFPTTRQNEHDKSGTKAQKQETGKHERRPESPWEDDTSISSNMRPGLASPGEHTSPSNLTATLPTSAEKESAEKQKDTLLAIIRNAHEQAENAQNNSEKAQALQIEQQANAILSKRFNMTYKSETAQQTRRLAAMATPKLWRERNPREQVALPGASSQQKESYYDLLQQLNAQTQQASQAASSGSRNMQPSMASMQSKPSAPTRSESTSKATDVLLEKVLHARELAEFDPSPEARLLAFHEMKQSEIPLKEQDPQFDACAIAPRKCWNVAETRLEGDARRVVEVSQDHKPLMSMPEIVNPVNPREQVAVVPETTGAPNLEGFEDLGQRDRGSSESSNQVNKRAPTNPRRQPQVQEEEKSQEGNRQHEEPRQEDRRQEDEQRDFDPAVLTWGEFFMSRFRSPEHENDLEAGKKSKKKKKAEYDVHGRKRIVGKKRKEREQHPKDPKANYSAGVAGNPEPTYLDKHGRTELEVFQSLVGIYFLGNAGAPIPTAQKTLQPASVMSDIFVPSRAAAYRHRNRGLYDRCISQDMKMRVMYSFSHYMISFLYLLQILVAATLTGLSSYTNTAGVALTTLGAINTVLAGILAWLNGQGMPVRYRRARDQFREVVRAIEDAERMFSTIDYMDWAPGTRPTPISERDRLFKMYEKARQDEEANYPDTHENADKSEIASNAKTLEGKIEKHKKQKKEKNDELKAMHEQVQKLNKKLAGGGRGRDFDSADFKSDGSGSDDDDDSNGVAAAAEKLSQSKLKEWADKLRVQEQGTQKAMAALAQEKKETADFFNAAQREVDKMCKDREVDADEARKRTKIRDAFKSK